MDSILPAITFAILVAAQFAAVIAVQIQGHTEFFPLLTSRSPPPGPSG